MNNLPDEDPKLLNFLRKNRSIIPPAPPEREDRLMAEIDLLPNEHQQSVSRSWWRYIIGGIGIVATGVVGFTIHQIVSPPEPSLAELHQIELYLEAHANPDSSADERANVTDADLDLFPDPDRDDSTIDSRSSVELSLSS
jgi:hypothetical protein